MGVSKVFLHAFLVPHRTLTKEEQNVKDEAKAIVERIEGGEEVAMATAHPSDRSKRSRRRQAGEPKCAS